MPRTAVGEGDEPGEDGEGEVLGVLEETGAVGGDADAVEGAGVVATGGVADVVATGDVLCVTVAGELGEGLARTGLAAGLSAIDPLGDAANTAAPRATRPRIATIGTSPIRLPRGESCRQLGQKPETGVKTLPQFRHRTGRRVRATAWLVAFFVRDRF